MSIPGYPPFGVQFNDRAKTMCTSICTVHHAIILYSKELASERDDVARSRALADDMTAQRAALSAAKQALQQLAEAHEDRVRTFDADVKVKQDALAAQASSLQRTEKVLACTHPVTCTAATALPRLIA